MLSFLLGRVNGQKISFSSIYSVMHVTSINDTQNPTLIQADGYDANLATIAVNATQPNAASSFIIGRGVVGSNSTKIFADPTLPVLRFTANVQLFPTISVKNSNSFVGINLGQSIQPMAQLDVNGTVKLGNRGTVINSIIKGVINYDLPTIVATGNSSILFSANGLALGSAVSVSTDLALDPRIVIAYALVTQPNVVTIYITNISTTNAVDPPAMNFYVTAIN